MSGTVVHLVHDPTWGWLLMRGNETFYDEQRHMRTWPTAYDAEQWFHAHCPDYMTLVKTEQDALTLNI